MDAVDVAIALAGVAAAVAVCAGRIGNFVSVLGTLTQQVEELLLLVREQSVQSPAGTFARQGPHVGMSARSTSSTGPPQLTLT